MKIRTYPTTTGYYAYKHVLPNDMYYPGMSKQQPSKRWQPSQYKTTSLQPYIIQYGWDNIEHVIIADGLTKEEAEQLENQLIEEGKRNGLCINKQGSGGRCRDNPTEYKREYRKNNPDYVERQREYDRKRHQTEKRKEYIHKYHQTEKYKEHRRNRYQNDPEYREKIKERQRQYRAKKKALHQ